jgi:hypothetical protein
MGGYRADKETSMREKNTVLNILEIDPPICFLELLTVPSLQEPPKLLFPKKPTFLITCG